MLFWIRPWICQWRNCFGYVYKLCYKCMIMTPTPFNNEIQTPSLLVLQNAIGRTGTVGFLVLLIFCQFCTGAATLTTTSRMVYTLARDHAAPSFLQKVNHHQLPANAVYFVVFIVCCFVITPFPLSDFVFEMLISATTITTHLAYGELLLLKNENEDDFCTTNLGPSCSNSPRL